MKVGSLGAIVFTVKADRVKTIRNLTYTAKANISTHAVHNQIGLIEHTGEAPAQVSFSMRVSRFLGADPLEAENKLREYLSNGTALTLTLGTERIGRNKWLVQQYKSSLQSTDRKGNPIDIDFNVTLIEYVKR